MDNNSQAKEHIHPGRLPAFWDRSVIFFANLKSLFFGNVQQLGQLESEVSGVNTYGGRLITVIDTLFHSKSNLLVLEKAPNKSILNYLKDALQLSLPEILIVDPGVYSAIKLKDCDKELKYKMDSTKDAISSHPAGWIDGYVTDDILVQWAQMLNKSNINSVSGCHNANNKLLLYYHLLEKGLPVIDTEVAQSSDQVQACLDKLHKKGYRRAVAKSQIGASGIGMISLYTSDHNSEMPDYMFFEGPCIIQGWMEPGIKGIEKIYSPSVQLFVDEKSVYIYDITEQILSRHSIHEGNIAYPPYLQDYPGLKDELMRQAAVAGKWLYSQSYRGTASVDYLVVIRNGELEVRICEINARVTGATYPSVLARHFIPHGAWIMRNLKTEQPTEGQRLLELLDNKGALFYPGKSEGLLPINFNLNDEGRVIKGQFLYIAENMGICTDGLKNFSAALPIGWEYDRD
jgi:hypothetical protein